MGRIHSVVQLLSLTVAALAGTGERTRLADLRAGDHVPDAHNGGRKRGHINRSYQRAALKKRNKARHRKACR